MNWLLPLALVFTLACGEDGAGAGLDLGAECTSPSDCDRASGQTCLTDFKGGYCGIADCRSSDQCPEDSACALYQDGVGYCFKTCTASSECNDFRSAATQADCSDSAPFLDDITDFLACVPPEME